MNADASLFDALITGNARKVMNELFPRSPQQPMPGTPALVEGLSPAADTGTAGVGTSSEIQRLNGLVAHYRRKDGEHERLIGKLLKLLNEDDLDGARDLVKDEYDSIHGPRE